MPYYYANDTYYTYNADAAGYEVVAPPPNADSVTPPPPTQAGAVTASTDDVQYVYPKNGQSAEQQATESLRVPPLGGRADRLRPDADQRWSLTGSGGCG